MEWIKCNKKLPDIHKRYLGYCENFYSDDNTWKGIVEVYFDPYTGWHRCENQDIKPVRVIGWCELPEIPGPSYFEE